MKVDFQKEYLINNGYTKSITVVVVISDQECPVTINITEDIKGNHFYYIGEYWLEGKDGSCIKTLFTPEQLMDNDYLDKEGYYWNHP